ncbi:MAG: NADPH-dependent 2,4-dienoyl-CoA reductase/sulfur reductase-like enzyme [Candidatus Poriferisodalaceae bacterium]|jgi:NADPH-dependent 2,4-dienoyl-CoA reductase/sulfur reductase-like enzyme
MDRIIVVGASLAGSRAAQHLRRLGHTGEVLLVGAEPHLPYDRPPLSKKMLTEDLPASDVEFHDAASYAELEIELRLSASVSALDTTKRSITVGDEDISFDGLIISTGASPRWIPGTEELPGVHVLRTIDDALRLRSELVPGAKVVVIGAGFIGSEAAAAASARGCSVTVVEAADAPLTRGLGSEMGMVCGSLHAAHGVDLRLGVGVEEVVPGSGPDGRVESVRLADGTVLEASVVVIGIGVVPATRWLSGSGVAVDNGVICDATLNVLAEDGSVIAGVYAAGDVVRAPNGWIGEEAVRVEHWTTATEQGMLAAANLLDPTEAKEYSSVPFVWSDQYEHRIQIAGHPHGDDEVTVLFGSVDSGSFVAGYQRGDRLAGIMALDSIRPFVKYRRLLSMDPTWTAALALAEELNAPS